jgi:hypothetical protein
MELVSSREGGLSAFYGQLADSEGPLLTLYGYSDVLLTLDPGTYTLIFIASAGPVGGLAGGSFSQEASLNMQFSPIPEPRGASLLILTLLVAPWMLFRSRARSSP